MKIVIQRVTRSCVKVNGSVISTIGKGLLLLVGISSGDTRDDLEYMTRKVLNIRLFDDENGKKWSKSVIDKEYEILCVSQFTLCSILKGNRVDFHNAMKPEESKIFYENFVEALKINYKPEMIKDGAFGQYMEVELCNDGPVTINLETNIAKNKESGDCS